MKHVCIGVSTPLKKTTPSFLPSSPPPPLNLQTVEASPFFSNLPYIMVFHEPCLVMTEQDILVYKLFLSLNTPDFRLYFI